MALNFTLCIESLEIQSIFRSMSAKQITVGLLISVFVLVANRYFFKFIQSLPLLNWNLKIYLLAYPICALIISINDMVIMTRNLVTYVANPCSILKSTFSCRFFVIPSTISFNVLILLSVFTSLERLYATYRYKPVSPLFSGCYAIVPIGLSIIIGSSTCVTTLLSTKNLNDTVICLTTTPSTPEKSFSNTMFLGTLVIACTLSNAASKLWNVWKLKKFVWFNQGQFNFRYRHQLHQNIQLDDSILYMNLALLSILVLIILLAFGYTQKIIVDPLQVAELSWLVSLLNQIYCLVYILAFMMGRTEFRKKVVDNLTKKILRKFKPKVSDTATIVEPVKRSALEMATKKYFNELEDMWNVAKN